MIEYQKILNKNLLNVFIEILKEVEVKGFLRKIKYFQVDVSDTPKEWRTIIAGNGFDLSIDNSLLRENDLYELHEKLKEISKGFKRQNN